MESNLKVFLILSFICLTRFSSEQSCGHSNLQKTVKIKKIDVVGENKRFLQNSEWQPIRIYLDYTTLDAQKDQVSNELISNLKKVMEYTVDIYQKLVNVRRLNSPLIIKDCYSSVTIGTNVSKTGVNYDLVIFPYFDLKANENLEAAAAVCATELSTDRPVGGFIGFGNNLDLSKKNALYNRSLVLLHEINHILSFNDELFPNFIDDKGVKKPLTDTITTKNVNGKKVTMIKSPKVLETARKHFNCKDMEGVELEDQGGTGTAGSHWESRIMYGDFMIGETITENVISEISLALMEDSGWYKVNYYTGGLFRYGKNKGCDFINSKCIQNGNSISENEFPTTNGSVLSCFAGRSSKGIAYVEQKTSDIEKIYQYFDDPKKGGYLLADYCPVTTSMNENGWYDSGSCWNGINKYDQGIGEIIGPNSYCFYSSLTYKDDESLINYKGKSFPVCYEVSCDYTAKTYTVKIRDVTLNCDKAGGATTNDKFDGTFYCADFNLICTKSVNCGDVYDCVNKKSLNVETTFDYTPKDSVDTFPIDLTNTLTASNFVTHVYLFSMLFMILIL